MDKLFHKHQTYNGNDFTQSIFEKGEYEDCIFINYNFSNVDLSGVIFANCIFKTCNLSSAKLNKTAIRDAQFIDCKLLGLHFNDCNPFLFSAKFENCNLILASFYKLKIKKTIFTNCNLSEVDFVEADLSSTIFHNCNFLNALFENTVLENADFRTSYNFMIDPDKNRLKKAKFSIQQLAGLLAKYDLEIE